MTATKKTATANDAFENMTNVGPEAFKEGYEKFAEGASAVAEYQKGSMEAIMASAGAFAKGVEKLAAEQTAFTKTAFEETVANAKAAAASKSVQEAFDLNGEFVRSAIEKNLAQVGKVAEIWIETTKQTVEPLTAQYGQVVEKIQAYRP